MLLIAVCTAGAHAGATAAERDRVQAVMEAAHANGDFDGSVLIAVDGHIVYQAAFGLADAEWSIPNTPETRFGIASLTKNFTAHLVMVLVERKMVALDDRISVHMTELKDRRIGEVTIRQLLSHTAGIGDHLKFADEEIPETILKRWEGFNGASIAMFKDFVPYAKMVDKPGERFVYSNDGYVLLGLIIEAVSRMSFEDALHRFVLEPAKMRDSGINHHASIIPRRARAYRREAGRLENAPWDDTGTHFSAGGMYSTVGDLYRWDRTLRSEQILSTDARTAMTTAASSEAMNVFGFERYGLGWWIHSHEHWGTLVMHPGASPQYSAVIVRGIDRDVVIVALANISSVPSMNRYVPALMDALSQASMGAAAVR